MYCDSGTNIEAQRQFVKSEAERGEIGESRKSGSRDENAELRRRLQSVKRTTVREASGPGEVGGSGLFLASNPECTRAFFWAGKSAVRRRAHRPSRRKTKRETDHEIGKHGEHVGNLIVTGVTTSFLAPPPLGSVVDDSRSAEVLNSSG